MDIFEWAIGVLSGILLSIISIWISNKTQIKNELKKKEEETTFFVYMKFMEIYSHYDDIVIAEKRKEEFNKEVRNKMWKLSWQIADRLRECDTIDLLYEILDVLFNKCYNSAQERYEKMKKINSSLKMKVNPNYSEAISKISNANFNKLAENLENYSCAPGSCI